MNPFTLDTIKSLIQSALFEPPTGDSWLDARYAEQVSIIGHTNPYYKLFYLLAQTLKPGLVVELGSWQATAAAHFAAGNPDGYVITVDIHKDDQAAKLRTLEAAHHYDNLTYLNRWTWDAVDFIKNLGQPIDIIFIDAWHDYQYARREWDLYAPLLASPALVICDDITTAYNFEGMLRFWDELPEPKFLFSEGLHGNIPMGFVIANGKQNVAENRAPDSTQQPTVTKRGRPRKESRAA